jgi:hypothetical protein
MIRRSAAERHRGLKSIANLRRFRNGRPLLNHADQQSGD